MMATSTNDLLRIHHRYPILAFLLALCNPSTILSGLTSAQCPDHTNQSKAMLHSMQSPAYTSMLARFSLRLPGSENRIGLTHFTHGLILHLIAAGIAAIMLWQALLLGMRGVIVFACWTWHEPFTWVGVGGLVHLLSTIAWRFCLGPVNTLVPFSRWNWSLSRSGGNLTLAHPHFARFLDLVFQIIGLMNYGYGTVMLSGTSLVSPKNGLAVFCLMSFASMSSRLLTIWLLEVWPEAPATLQDMVKGDGSQIELLGVNGRSGGFEII
jgi:hypothetical protein